MVSSATVYVTAGLTVVLWLASRFFEWNQARAAKNSERIRYLKALYSEIDFNTKDMEDFIQETDIKTICEAIKKDRNLIPHITDARHTQIYKNEINLIHHIGSEYIKHVVTFYGNLEKIRSQIEGVQQDSYRVISLFGRATVVERIYTLCEQCAFQGQLLLQEMEDCYPELSLKRNDRPLIRTGQSISELKSRSAALGQALTAKRNAKT